MIPQSSQAFPLPNHHRHLLFPRPFFLGGSSPHLLLSWGTSQGATWLKAQRLSSDCHIDIFQKPFLLILTNFKRWENQRQCPRSQNESIKMHREHFLASYQPFYMFCSIPNSQEFKDEQMNALPVFNPGIIESQLNSISGTIYTEYNVTWQHLMKVDRFISAR